MKVDIVVPTLGESVTEATVAKWLKRVGDSVAADEPLVELETDKVSLEVPAPSAGKLSEILASDGADVLVGAVLGNLDETSTTVGQPEPTQEEEGSSVVSPKLVPSQTLSPAVRKLVDENSLDPAKILATGAKGQITKGDVLAFMEKIADAKPASASQPLAKAAAKPVTEAPQPVGELPIRTEDPRGEERVRMSRLRQIIAQRLKQAQNTAAILTTYNECRMDTLMALRSEYRDAFEKKHGARLGFLSFFVKAAIIALKEIPAVNAEIYGDEVIYKNYYDIGVAVGTSQGLVVPIVRDADKMSFAEIENTIADYGRRARDGKLTIEEMTGGTFTISNGGVYGSLMSMPILNPPQSGILGMHTIQKRPIAINGNVEIASMMYLALSYDHRIVDGREAVTFLVRMKEVLEDPQRLLIDV
ncbi:MAG: dihydrolipoyllysine-residue succinyltransferase [Rhodospirillaceae bacterium]|nr:dihydrolipoyllysine-residue succinyltransferase [Rhodospirillaceae bacterium]|tara:strand:- start:2545 stop:3795 length:1251 start_codon:yes stop_codon:yes gene_type:complete